MDTTPITARLSVIATSVSALNELRRLEYEEFASDHILHGSAERDFQVAIQAALDIASMILTDLSVEIPLEYSSIFPKLADVGVIPADFAARLVGMAKFRNVLVHLYLEVDLNRVYHYLQHNLDDFELFARYIGEYLSRIP
jgi:uncharacterized protein YutE (UPF0331/DUF86 family)